MPAASEPGVRIKTSTPLDYAAPSGQLGMYYSAVMFFLGADVAIVDGLARRPKDEDLVALHQAVMVDAFACLFAAA